jgi:uncharacterized protein (DUF1330 family)
MKETPLTLQEANALCIQYKHVVGQPFCGEYLGLGNVEDVVVAPFNKLNKWIFLKYYQKFNDARQALSFYNDNDYDVIVIGRSKNGQVTCMDINAHMTYATSNPDFFIELD